ncbi:MAG TPA: CAP domain-containing protein [Woeseiaceae bacterium]|nr:CAP domain-containing protein [Woeseiaceae bacterium]
MHNALTLIVALGLMIASSWCRADAIDVANALRTTGCADRPMLDTPFSRNEALDAAARHAATGEPLQAAAFDAGYPAKRIARINVSTVAGEELRRLLETQFCAILADPELVDIGMYLVDDETWLLMAARLTLDAGASTASEAQRLFTGINKARATARVCGATKRFAAAPALHRSSLLDAAAMQHAMDIASRGELGHDGSDGSTVSDRVARTGYEWQTVGENVAAGQSGADEVVDTWLASPGHCRNLMDARFTETGIAVALNEGDDRVIYWVQVYGAIR